MKKLLIATAAMAVVAGAQAQSSVTVYGVVDMNMTSTDVKTVGSQTGIGSNTLSSSRVGLKGTEDLGGGLKAEFQLEGALNPATGQLGTTGAVTGSADDTAPAAALFNRESWIGLSSATLGSIRLGRTDITGAQGLDSTVGQAGNLSDATLNLGYDAAGIVRYTTPTYAGFSAQVGYLNASTPTITAQTTTADATTGEATNGSMTSVYAQYEAGAFGVYAGQTTNKISATYDQTETTYGAKYDFGFAAVGAYQSVKEANAAGSSNGDIKQTIISASAPVAFLGAGVKAHAVYAKLKSEGAVRTSLTSGDLVADNKKTTLALSKGFSKRTTGYIGMVDTQYETTANNDTKAYVVGVSHNF